MNHSEQELELRLRAMERVLAETTRELRNLRRRLPKAAQREIEEIRDEWHGIHYKWWVGTLIGVLVLFTLSYALYTQLGWVADQRQLPVGSDWLLRRLPMINTLPVLSWGWFGLHFYAAGAAAAYYPRRIPFLLFTLAMYMLVRTAFVFLSPIGQPEGMVDMRLHDFLFSKLLGTWTFTNEFVFSGHTAIPFLFFLFFETPRLKALMLAGSLAMAVSVLLSRNHYTVDVLAAYLVGYAIYGLSETAYERLLSPLFRKKAS